MSNTPSASSNLLEILGVSGREDVITNLLAHCYNNSNVFRCSFLRSLGVPLDGAGSPSGTAYTRVLTGDVGVPDIVIVNPDGAGRNIVVIENKLGAIEGEDQTQRYSSPDCLKHLATRFSFDVKTVEPHYVFLTLFPDERPASPKFVPVSYEALLQQEWTFGAGDGSWVAELTRAWLDLLARFYQTGRLRATDILLERLRENDPLEGSFLAFRSFMHSVPCPPGLSYLGSWRSSQAGRRYYLAQFGKGTWQPSEMDQSGQTWRLDSETCFNIHIEPQFNVLSGKFSIFLHYETNPYVPQKAARSSLGRGDFDAYGMQRGRFVSVFRTVCPSDCAVGVGWNQIAKATLSLDGLSVEASFRRFGDLFRRISKAVDKTLQQIRSAPENRGAAHSASYVRTVRSPIGEDRGKGDT